LPYGGQLGDLRQERVQAHRARVPLQRGQQRGAVLVAFRHQLQQAAGARLAQAGDGLRAEDAVRPRPCCGHDPLDTARGLDAVAAALHEQGLAQPVLHQLHWADLIGVGAGRRAEPEGLADLRTVALRGAGR
jgi:hypothetical protein